MSQAPELYLPAPLPAAYTDEETLTASLSRKGTPEPGPGLYSRDGTVEVTDIEAAISELTIPSQRLNVVVSSGMAAVSGATEFALSCQGESKRDPRPALAYAMELYSQTPKSIKHLTNMGVRTKRFYVSDGEYVENLFEKDTPDVIFAETVANAASMPVLNMYGLLEKTRAAGEDGPIMVLDNTLPLSTGLDFKDILRPNDRVLVVESVTKSGMHNSGHLGVVYSRNTELMDAFRRYKATKGLVTSTYADAAILTTLEVTTPGFHERNQALSESTGKVASALARAEVELGVDSDFTVSFPGLPEHPNNAYVEEFLPDGVSPVVFMGCRIFKPEAARTLFKRIVEHPRVREQIQEGQVFLGQSFGFKEARVLYDTDTCQMRVSGGYDIDADALAGALFEAAVET